MQSLKGSLLIASPGLADPNFSRTVVLIVEHNEEGALGVVLNRPGKVSVSDLWSSLSSEPCGCDSKTFVGGPVQENSVLILHGFEDLSSGSQEVISGVYLGSELSLLEMILARSGDTSPEVVSGSFRLYCGYAGWGAGQLDQEMDSGGWLTLPAKLEHIFQADTDELWTQALRGVGGPYEFFSLMPPNPELN